MSPTTTHRNLNPSLMAYAVTVVDSSTLMVLLATRKLAYSGAGVAVGLGVSVAVGLGVLVAVGLGVLVAVGRGVCVAVACGVWVAVGLGV